MLCAVESLASCPFTHSFIHSLTHICLTVSWSRGLAPGSSLTRGVKTDCSAHAVIRERAIASLQRLAKLEHAAPASS